jgi:hypothetical protein
MVGQGLLCPATHFLLWSTLDGILHIFHELHIRERGNERWNHY